MVLVRRRAKKILKMYEIEKRGSSVAVEAVSRDDEVFDFNHVNILCIEFTSFVQCVLLSLFLTFWLHYIVLSFLYDYGVGF